MALFLGDRSLVIIVGVFGYFISRMGFQAAPLLLGYVLGPMIEEHFRRAMLMSRGDMMTFITHPISAFFISVSFILILSIAFKNLIKYIRRRDFNQERKLINNLN